MSASSPAPTAHEVLDFVTRQIVEDPDAVEISVEAEEGEPVELAVTVGPGDLGRVIGRRGRVAQAIRTVVAAAGARDGIDVEVEFVE